MSKCVQKFELRRSHKISEAFLKPGTECELKPEAHVMLTETDLENNPIKRPIHRTRDGAMWTDKNA